MEILFFYILSITIALALLRVRQAACTKKATAFHTLNVEYAFFQKINISVSEDSFMPIRKLECAIGYT